VAAGQPQRGLRTAARQPQALDTDGVLRHGMTPDGSPTSPTSPTLHSHSGCGRSQGTPRPRKHTEAGGGSSIHHMLGAADRQTGRQADRQTTQCAAVLPHVARAIQQSTAHGVASRGEVLQSEGGGGDLAAAVASQYSSTRTDIT
jgi:hypothetical protein